MFSEKIPDFLCNQHCSCDAIVTLTPFGLFVSTCVLSQEPEFDPLFLAFRVVDGVQVAGNVMYVTGNARAAISMAQQHALPCLAALRQGHMTHADVTRFREVGVRTIDG